MVKGVHYMPQSNEVVMPVKSDVSVEKIIKQMRNEIRWMEWGWM